MVPIAEYDKIDIDSQLCDALSILKRNYETLKTHGTGNFHKTLFVIDGDDKIVGKLSMYDLIRSLVPEPCQGAGDFKGLSRNALIAVTGGCRGGQ